MAPALPIPIPLAPRRRDKAQMAAQVNKPPPVWYTTAIFIIVTHLAAVYCSIVVAPWQSIPMATKIYTFVTYQVGVLGVTMGYHRYWSHHAFEATFTMRAIMAIMGLVGFQGSAQWWAVRHRLHHRYTDDPVHDPYAATKGMWYAHVGWIFQNPVYARWHLIDKKDLDRDVVAKFQHRWFTEGAVFLCFVLPVLLGHLWGDKLGAFIWSGLVARVFIWHSIWFINSLAHWDGHQHYSDEMTASGNLFVAALTGGEGNHNYHSFPTDYRNEPVMLWDPTGWLIWFFHKFTPLIPKVQRVPETDVLKAQAHMFRTEALKYVQTDPKKRAALEAKANEMEARIPDELRAPSEEVQGRVWGRSELERYVFEEKRKVLLVHGWALDVTKMMAEHPGGASIIAEHLVFPLSKSAKGREASGGPGPMRDATQAFLGKFNNHTRWAKEQAKMLRVARIELEEGDVPSLM